MRFVFMVLGVLIGTLCFMTPSTWGVNRVLSLDGDRDYVEVSDSDSLDLDTGMTVEMWVQVFSLTGNQVNIFLNKEDAYEFGIKDFHDPHQNFAFAIFVNDDCTERTEAFLMNHLLPCPAEFINGLLQKAVLLS